MKARVLALVATLAAVGACTTRETGSIELLASAGPPSPPPPKGMTPPCSAIEDCPGDPKHRLCRVSDGECVECLSDVDCSDPKRPRCDEKGSCTECRPDDAACFDAASDAP